MKCCGLILLLVSIGLAKHLAPPKEKDLGLKFPYALDGDGGPVNTKCYFTCDEDECSGSVYAAHLNHKGKKDSAFLDKFGKAAKFVPKCIEKTTLCCVPVASQ